MCACVCVCMCLCVGKGEVGDVLHSCGHSTESNSQDTKYLLEVGGNITQLTQPAETTHTTEKRGERGQRVARELWLVISLSHIMEVIIFKSRLPLGSGGVLCVLAGELASGCLLTFLHDCTQSASLGQATGCSHS